MASSVPPDSPTSGPIDHGAEADSSEHALRGGPTSDEITQRQRVKAIVQDRELCAQLSAFLSKKLPHADVDDVRQEVFAALWRAKSVPADRAQQRRFLFAAAKSRISNHRRTKERRKKTESEAMEMVVEAVFYDTVASRDFLAKLRSLVPKSSEVTLTWWARELLGEPLLQIANEVDIPYGCVVARVRTLQRRLVAVAATLVLLLMVGSAYYFLRPKPEYAQKPQEKTTLQEAPTIDPQKVAAEERRRQARALCDQEDWLMCLTRLDQAKRLDPAGEDDSAVKELRRVSTEHVRANAHQEGEGNEK
jgi:DNA-directed RNA polymerase specialized sigma24 family protein